MFLKIMIIILFIFIFFNLRNFLKLNRNLVRKKIIPTLELIYPGCSERINNLSQKMSKYNKERIDLIELAY